MKTKPRILVTAATGKLAMLAHTASIAHSTRGIFSFKPMTKTTSASHPTDKQSHKRVATNGGSNSSTLSHAGNTMDTVLTPTTKAPGIKDLYEWMRPMIVWLGLTELVWIASWLLAAEHGRTAFSGTVVVWIVLMLAWMMLVIYLSTGDFFFSHTRWLSNLIGVVLVVVLTVAWFTRTPVVWEGLVRAAAVTPVRQLVAIHVLRLLAIGTVVKYFQKQLPLHFVVFGSLPDFLFASSAVVVTVLATNGPIGHDFLVVWHVIGFSAFLGAGLSMFFTVPSALRLYQTKPDTSIVFRFPMVLAPNFTVPLFMIAHLFALVKLLAV